MASTTRVGEYRRLGVEVLYPLSSRTSDRSEAMTGLVPVIGLHVLRARCLLAVLEDLLQSSDNHIHKSIEAGVQRNLRAVRPAKHEGAVGERGQISA